MNQTDLDGSQDVHQLSEHAVPRFLRFVAYLFDAIFVAVLSMALIFLFWRESLNPEYTPDVAAYKKAGLIGLFAWALMNALTLMKYGQTLGKRIVGIKIVTLSGQLPALWRTILLRPACGVLGLITPALSVIAWFDPLLIFRKDRRCLHDYIAGTVVVYCNRDTSLSHSRCSECHKIIVNSNASKEENVCCDCYGSYLEKIRSRR